MPTKNPLPLPRPIVVAFRPLVRFFRTQSASGILLLAATVLALVWANSGLSASYHHLLEEQISIRVFGHGITWPLHHWINDALMAVFFFLVGMEIKRELVLGELNSVRRAVLPAIAAAGGMAVPALLYSALKLGGAGMPGWGVPVATDIAFALGCLAVLKGRVPASLVVFLMALAIFDDLGAILVIALFYGGQLHAGGLLAAGGILLALVLMNLFGVRRIGAYLAMGVLLWLAVLQSGIHATIAGVALGLCIPSRSRRDPSDVEGVTAPLEALRAAPEDSRRREEAIAAVEGYLHEAEAPLDKLVHMLHPWVAFFIIPVFALANAGVDLGALSLSDLAGPVSLGTVIGLFLGKQLGIFGATALAVKLRLSPMPANASWSQVYGVAMLGGIGFTMSLFIAALAFAGVAGLNGQAKIGILLGSLASAVGGLLFLRFVAGNPTGAADTEKGVPAVPPAPGSA